jgi:hypothetical protein
MQINQDSIIGYGIALLCIGIFIAAFPLKNWFEIKKNDKQKLVWDNWLSEKPSRAEYSRLHNQDINGLISCDYCNEIRQVPRLEMVIPSGIKFGALYNTRNKYLHFKTYVCPQCNSELYRERYES